MDAFLDQQRTRGALDSSGGFSVNPFKAWEKMAAFQSEDPGFYLLRLVQAGVVMKCEKISLGLGRDFVQVEMLAPDLEELSVESVRAGFGQAFPKGEHSATAYFMNGLNHLLVTVLDRLSLSWVHSDGSATHLHLTKEGIASECDRQEPGKSHLKLFFPRLHDRAKIADETKSVHRGCASCPVPVFLDGSQVNTPYNPYSLLYQGAYPKSKLNSYLPTNFVLGKRLFAWRDVTLLPPLDSAATRAHHCYDRKGYHKGSVREDLMVFQDAPTGATGFLKLGLNLEQRSIVTNLQAGVAVSVEYLEGHGVEAFVGIDGMETDITGTKLIHNEDYAELMKSLRSETLALLNAAMFHSAELKARFDWTTERKAKAGTASVLGGIYLTSALILLPVPVFGKIWGLGMLTSTAVAGGFGLQTKSNLDQELRAELFRCLSQQMEILSAKKS